MLGLFHLRAQNLESRSLQLGCIVQQAMIAEGVLEGDGCIADLQDVVNSHEVSFIPVNSPYNQVG